LKEELMRDPVLLLLRTYSRLFYFVKHRLRAGNLRGFGFLSRLAWRNTVLTVEDGVRIVFDHRAAANYACLLGGHYNEPETHVFVRRVLDGLAHPCSFVDVGANVGEMLVDFARHPRVKKALAFEPSVLCARIIERSCSLNGLRNVRVVAKAVGKGLGRGTMQRNAHSQCSTPVRMEEQGTAVDEELFERVEMTTLDVEIRHPSGLWIMLIDVEGGELDVMRGGRRFLQTVQPLIIFEYHEVTRTHFSLDDVQAELGSDYELFRLRSDGLLDHDLLKTWNCVAVPRSSPFHALITPSIMGDRVKRLSRPHAVMNSLAGEPR
jgi:FkbM family methyltransferase